ncbi:hypothetical protein PAHAL_1G317900 [Panicum hallii]|uniref:Uncharacterized protein n=1 Tax=Panicum hallii TaxID=206008 RepID=A0A2T8KX00_9POAL|nr:hypothetical protein PAHAL_1G317900 [Panicum hallii]
MPVDDGEPVRAGDASSPARHRWRMLQGSFTEDRSRSSHTSDVPSPAAPSRQFATVRRRHATFAAGLRSPQSGASQGKGMEMFKISPLLLLVFSSSNCSAWTGPNGVSFWRSFGPQNT